MFGFTDHNDEQTEDKNLDIMQFLTEKFGSFDARFDKLEGRVNSLAQQNNQERFSLAVEEEDNQKSNGRVANLRDSYKAKLLINSDEEDGKSTFTSKGRRKSIIEIENRDRETFNHRYLQTYPDFDHIKLERATIRSFDKFIEEVKLFQQKHKIKINPGTQIKEGIIHKLLASARDEGYDCEEADFYSYNLEDISRLMRLHVKPENKMDFEFKLKKNLDFPIM